MIRFVIVTAAETTLETRVAGEIVEIIQPAGTILRSGFCRDDMFNRQALASGEIAIEIDAANWPVNDITHRIDLSGDKPTPVLKT